MLDAGIEKDGTWDSKFYQKRGSIADCGRKFPPEEHILQYRRDAETLTVFVNPQKYTIKGDPIGRSQSTLENKELAERMKETIIAVNQEKIESCKKRNRELRKPKL